jgi:hypothetical protein
MPEGMSQAIRALSGSPKAGPIPAPSSPRTNPQPTSSPQPATSAAAESGVPAPEQPVESAQKPVSAEASPTTSGPVANAGGREQTAVKTTPPEGLDDQVEQTGCATCGGFHSGLDGGAFHASMGCANGECIPGRPPCDYLDKHFDNFLSAFATNMYAELCCPDPCYQPRWEPGANASFFADYARPRTVTRFRYDNLEDMVRPDRNQFWIKEVAPLGGRNPRRPITNPAMRLQQVYLYQEAAGPLGSFFVEIPYRQINPNFEPTQAGFGDINFGIKSLFYDRELLQLAFQFRTFTPSGNFSNNLGTGNFALDPSILASLKLGPETYFQGQFGNWIPLAGNANLAGGVFYWLMSLNQTLWRPTPSSPLIATLEMDGWSFENGGYTTAIKGGGGTITRFDGGGVSYFNIGPGLRQSICNKVDFGGAITFATNSVHWAQPWFRFEVRFLF